VSDPTDDGPRDDGLGPSGRGSSARIVAVVIAVGLVVVGLVVLLGTSGDGDEADTSAQVLDDRAPALVGVSTAGEAVDLESLRGRWVLVNFFATWCPPCVAEHPELVEFSSRHPDDATVLSIAFDEPPSVIEEFFADNGGDWPVIAEDTGGIVLDYGVVKLPESYLIAPDGTVVEKLAGGVTADGLDRLIAEHG
jgi:cytochrome c biogenesis protein CcmG/thiol:disulfide interchange protein DsbE